MCFVFCATRLYESENDFIKHSVLLFFLKQLVQFFSRMKSLRFWVHYISAKLKHVITAPDT